MKDEKQIAVSEGYQNFLREIQGLLEKGLHKAYKAVDNIKVQTYWQIGERIVREELEHKNRAEYGKFLIKNLARDLNFSRLLLYEIVKFYNLYPIMHTVCAQLSWSHYDVLIRITNAEERAFYQNKVVQHAWSVRELSKKLKSQLYEKASPQEIKALSQTTLPVVEALEVFKDDYDFNFLELEIGNKEKELENLIIRNIEDFLKELGEDFAFLGRQAPIKIENQTHYIDLVVYHKGIPCNILIDLKAGKIDSNDVGQMNKYVGYYKRHRQYEHERDTIGLIIGRETGLDVEYALDNLEKQIFVAVYQTKLPSKAKIGKAVKKLS